jgi:hypothetical protein
VDLWDLTRLLFRRWYFAVPMLVVSMAATILAGMSVKPDYKAVGHLQLIPPALSPDTTVKAGRVRNPWADLGVEAIGQAAIIKVQDQAVIDTMVKGGYSASFTLTMDSRSPIVTIETVGSTPAQASSTVAEIIRLLSADVAEEQSQYKVAQADSITSLSLDSGSNVTKVTSKLKRALVVVGGASLLVTAGTTIGLDAWLRRRTRRRSGPAATPSRGPLEAAKSVVAGIVGPIEVRRINGTAERTPIDQIDTKKPMSPAAPDMEVNATAALPLSEGRVFRSQSSADAEQRPAGQDASNWASRGEPEARPTKQNGQAEIESSDATIVIPMSFTPWTAREDKSQRS